MNKTNLSGGGCEGEPVSSSPSHSSADLSSIASAKEEATECKQALDEIALKALKSIPSRDALYPETALPAFRRACEEAYKLGEDKGYSKAVQDLRDDE